MPNTPGNVNAQLLEKVNILEKALANERQAKRVLEDKLDAKAQVNFDQNKDILDALEHANDRQIQFQFLALLTQDLLSDKNIDEMIHFFVLNLSKLMSHCPVLQITQTAKKSRTISRMNLTTNCWTRLDWNNQYNDALSYMLNQDDSLWHREEKEGNQVFAPLKHLIKSNSILYLPLHISKTQSRLLILDLDHYCYDKGFKETLNIAGQQFSSALKKRTTEIELSYNFQVLQSTLSELRSTQQQLVHSEKMASLGQLSAGIAHEINNPIGFITSNLHVLKDYSAIYNQALNTYSAKSISMLKEHPKLKKDLAFARSDIDDLINSCIEGVERISEIVLSLKAFSKKEKDEFSQINLNEIIKSSLKIVWNQLKYDHEVIENLAIDLPEILGNYGQLQQVLVNLFVNSAQAMKGNGQLTVTSNVVGHYIEVSVTDTGCGMDNKTIKKLFEPFYTTKSENEGTGLGLSVSYAIIEKHNATISVNSEQDIGSTFTLRFPKLSKARE